MATLRSSLPSRLRQLLSGDGAAGSSLKLESEPPPKVKAFIDRVIESPLHDIAIPLSGFHWEYGKVNFHHWRPLFLHFETYFRTYICCLNGLQLSDNFLDDNISFPKHAVLQILRVMQIILENCPNKSSFSGLEHFKLLLASTDAEVLIATLDTLSALVKINPSKLHVSGKLIGCGSMNSCLLSLAQGWGSKEEGLGLFSCIMANERTQEEGLCLFPVDGEKEWDKLQYRLGSTLHFEFHACPQQDGGDKGDIRHSSHLQTIHIPDLHLRKEDDLVLLKQYVEQYNVPLEHRFSLLTRIRYARAFRALRICRQYSRISLLAFIVLVQSSDAHEELVQFFANEPEYTNELIRLVQSEESMPGSIRTLAMLALSAQLAAYSSSHERARILSGSSIISAGGNRMLLLNVLQKAVLSLNTSNDPSAILFVDALLQFYLLHVISSSSSGSAIRGSGMVPTLVPLLQDSEPSHMLLICSAVKTLQKLMDYSNAAVSLFKDLGGVDLLAQRLQIEIDRVIGVVGENNTSMIIGDSSQSDDDILYSQRRLIKALLKALGSATYAPTNSTRSQNTYDNSLASSLSLIFQNVKRFGGDIYFSAVTVMSEIIHKDPTCFSVLHELGLPDSFLSSVIAGVLPSSKALTCIPSGLGAICLNAKGLEAVKETKALRFLVDAFTTRPYVLPLNEGVVPLANAVEELLRHVSSLRSTGVDIIIEIIDKLSCFGEDTLPGCSDRTDANTAMETESETQEHRGLDCLEAAVNAVADGITNERFIQLCIYHVMVLVHRTMENSETCRLFVEKKGIEALMKLLLRPSIAQSSEGMSIALHSTMVFKGFTQNHSAQLAHAFCSSLREHLRRALVGIGSISGSFLLDPKSTPDYSIFSSLFVTEFLLFLAASKDNRWVSALLTEFGNGSKDVLEDIGRVQQAVLWQIALLEDHKNETEAESCSTNDTQVYSSSETEEQRFTSFRQLLDPLLRRRVSGWGIESQFFDLINLYRDLGRATGVQHRLTIDGTSGLRSRTIEQPHPSNPLNSTNSNKKEVDKQRSYYSSCCDMMRSLSFHISYLFLELGKAMLLPSRRREDSANISTAAKSVASTFSAIILDHLNFGGSDKKSDSSISTKCRYLGKVIDFTDSILLDRPESCNPIFVNCFYCYGVVNSILTTFEATSQLLFTVNRAPLSPMDIDDNNMKAEKDETENSWLYGPLASYGRFMDHLVTSSFIFSSSTKNLLEQSLTDGNIPLPRDAESFVKLLQNQVLKAILPIWNHPQFIECSFEFVTKVISIIRHIYSGVEVKNTSNSSGTRTSGPPPDESAISLIVEMGFSRSRAEEALRQVGTNRVDMAMEWLLSHPEEIQEDDELARALAMSLGNPETLAKEEKDTDANEPIEEEETVQVPPPEELLSSCVRLLHMKDPPVFPVRDLLVTLCNQDDEQLRSNVIAFLVHKVKCCSLTSDTSNFSMLSSLFHVLALILHENAGAREIASKHGLIKIALDLLSQWNENLPVGEMSEVPKWVTPNFLAIDRMLQVDPKLNPEIPSPDQLQKDNLQNAVIISEEKAESIQSTLGLCTNFIEVSDQKTLISIACRCIQNQLPSETMHAVLQLCATLTRSHSIALNFLDAGGLHSLLHLPTQSLFSGFDNFASTIIRHILEDSHTLQQAMELEIRHTVSTNRQPTGRFTPRNFLLNLASVVSRDPVIFLKAAQSVCQVEMVGERPYIVLSKDREKEKSKEKEKEKMPDKDKQQLVHGKLPDPNTKAAKSHRKPPQSFVTVLELLLECITFFVPPAKEDNLLSDMEIDDSASKGKGKAIVGSSEENRSDNQEASASLAKTVFILKLMTEILLTYPSSIHVLLRKDAEFGGCGGYFKGNGIFFHALHNFLPYSGNIKKDKKNDGDWRQKLATRTSQFLVASSVRSTEGRRRIFTEINNVLNNFVDSSDGSRAPDPNIQAFVDLLNDILAARSPMGSYISSEASATFIEAGLVRSLTQTLKVLDLDHSESAKVVTGIVKSLESVSKEHVQSSDLSSGKSEASRKPTSLQDHVGSADNAGDGPQSLETSQPNQNDVLSENVAPFNTIPTMTGSDSVTEDMEHDRDLDSRENEDDFMHDTSEDALGNENGIASVGVIYEIPPDVQDNMVDDDDEDMTGDDGDEDDEDDDDENNDLEDEDHHISHQDAEQDEHEMEEDEFDEDVLEEEEEDEEDEDGVILGLEEGINGINVLDHIEVFSRDDNFSNEALHVMPVEVFGSRRHGRSTSIYNLLGRNGDHSNTLQHRLLMEPTSAHAVPLRPSDNAGNILLSERNIENTSSRLDTIFRSLRGGRHHRFNMWGDDSQQRNGSNSLTVPQGTEELLISLLRRPTEVSLTEQNMATQSQDNDNETQLQEAEASLNNNEPGEDNTNVNTAILPPDNVPITDSTQVTDAQAVEMQFERNDAAPRDFEVVSQESGGSGATIGESLRSLEVEIGSADGHEDGEDRQGPVERLPSSDPQLSRSRRGSTPVTNRDTSLQTTSDILPHSTQESDQNGPSEEQQIDRVGNTGAIIDPAFLDALPEELRAEVLSSQQSQAAQTSNAETQPAGEIDPEFLAALPPDIRAEVLAQQQAQRLHQSQELEGQPVEMDTVSIIATFPSELREEVLLTSPDAILANLTPALVAEANMLRERLAHRYNNRALFGMYTRNRRGMSSRRGESSLDRSVGTNSSRRFTGGKLIEADGAPLVDTDALKALIRLLRVVQPLYKSQLQRLFLNLCAHLESRTILVQLLMNILMLDTRGPTKNADDAIESPFRLYGCQSSVMYSRPQFLEGVPPLLSRRILETLTYLARNHPLVAKILLHLELPQELPSSFEDRGKSAIIKEVDIQKTQQLKADFCLVLLLGLLKQPLYLRSIAHLEQLLNLLDVVIDNAVNNSDLSKKSGDSPIQESAPQTLPPNSQTSSENNPSSSRDPKGIRDISESTPSTSGVNSDHDIRAVMFCLPHTELRLLCSLLAREGLSDNAYVLVADVLKKLMALAPMHCHLFITELASSMKNLTKSAMKELHGYGEATKTLFSTTSSDGTVILRVLQSLSSLVTLLLEKEKDPHCSSRKEHNDALSQVWDINASLEPLWLELSICISKIENCSDAISDLSGHPLNLSAISPGVMPSLPPGSQNILPFIESFFVTCEKLCPGHSSSNLFIEEGSISDSQNLTGCQAKVDEKYVAFVKFSEKHRKLLNAFIKQNPGLLEKSFSLMLRVPRFIDFDNKRAHFRAKIKHQHDHHHSPLRISVRRAYILEDSYNQLRMRPTQDLKGRLTVHFQGEEGIDAGGLTREWYQCLSRVIFDKGALLFTTVGNESTFQPNPNSVYQTEHLSYFKFVGRVVGKALFDGQLLDVHFTRSFYKHILGVKVTYHDIEAIDPDYFKNLKWMLENDISDILDLTFSMDADEEKLILYERAEVTDYELIPGGRNIRVTEENKHQYVDLVAEHRLTTAIRPQINAFMEGFNELISKDLITIFNDKELELLISGLPDIDLDDMRANTEYSGYTAASPVIQWFWDAVQSFSKEDKARLLQFVTGTSKVPLEGFSALQGISGSQRFQIHKAYGTTNHLPSAHTCFNQLDLPEYSCKEQLEERLLLAIHEANEGFGFG